MIKEKKSIIKKYWKYFNLFLCISFYLYISSSSFAQNNEITININLLKKRIKSSETRFNNRLNEIIKPNKYIKIDIIVDPNIDIIKIEELKVNVSNLSMKCFYRGNKVFDNEKIKFKEAKNNIILINKKKEGHYRIKYALRYASDNGISTAGYGYDLNDGTYFVRVELHKNGVIYISNSESLFVR